MFKYKERTNTLMKLYIDTCVYRDLLDDNRISIMNKDLSMPTRKFFSLLYNQKHEHQIVLSTLVLEELGNKTTSERYQDFFSKYKSMFIKVDYSDDELLAAQKQSSEDYKDALHCILAEREKVDVIITRNVNHFKQFTNTQIWKPEEFTNQLR